MLRSEQKKPANSARVCVFILYVVLWYKFTNKTSLHRETNSRASACSAVPVEAVSSLAQLTFTYYTLGALKRHVVNIIMVYNDSVFTALIQSNLPWVMLLWVSV